MKVATLARGCNADLPAFLPLQETGKTTTGAGARAISFAERAKRLAHSAKLIALAPKQLISQAHGAEHLVREHRAAQPLCPMRLNRNPRTRAHKRDFATFGTVMKDAAGFQTQEMLYSIRSDSTGTLAGPPGLYGRLKITLSCVQWPVGPVTFLLRSAVSLRPSRTSGANRASPDLHPSRQPRTPLLLSLIRRAGKEKRPRIQRVPPSGLPYLEKQKPHPRDGRQTTEIMGLRREKSRFAPFRSVGSAAPRHPTGFAISDKPFPKNRRR